MLLILTLLASADPAAAQGKLAFIRGGGVWVANTDGSGARQLTSGGEDEHPAMSPDGQWVVFQREGMTPQGRMTALMRVPTAGGPAQPVVFQGVQQGWSASFSADGKQLVFAGLTNQRQIKKGEMTVADVFLAVGDLATGQVRLITKTPKHNLDVGYLYENPAMSPDGRTIAYQESGSDVSGGWVLLDLTGKALKRFPPNPKDYTPYWRPQFTPDGKQILCYSPVTSEGQVNRILLVDLATLAPREVTRGLKPTFVEGGWAIVFERYRKGEGLSTERVPLDLWYLSLSGGEPRKILENAQAPAGQR
jgi:Tol biopolymer transport system component